MFTVLHHCHSFLRAAQLPFTQQGWRTLSTSSRAAIKQMPPRPSITEAEISEAFLKGSGPGGQKINKTSSAVQLKHLPTGIVVKSQATRSRTQNRKIARLLLAERLEEMEKGLESRRGVKAAVASKRKASKTKKAKRKYKKLDEGMEGSSLQEDAVEGAEGDGFESVETPLDSSGGEGDVDRKS